jgi:hypothetical protein
MNPTPSPQLQPFKIHFNTTTQLGINFLILFNDALSFIQIIQLHITEGVQMKKKIEGKVSSHILVTIPEILERIRKTTESFNLDCWTQT